MTRSVKFANLILIVGVIISIVLLLYVLSLSGSRPPATLYKYHFLILALLVVFLGLLCRGKESTKVGAALLFLSAGISVYTIEVILGVYLFMHTPGVNKRLHVNFPDKFQVMTDLRKNGSDAYPHAFPSNYIATDGLNYKGIRIFPLGAISNRTTVFCNEEGKPVIYKTDEHGFRNPANQYITGEIDIALIGDSFAQGFCVKNGEDIAGRLRIKNRKVLNLGMEGSGPLIELGILSEYVKPFKPKRVFWLYFEGNDMPNLSWEKAPTLMKYLENNFSQNLVQHQDVADKALSADIENKIANKEEPYAEKKDSDADISQSILSVLTDKKMMIRIMKFYNLRLKLGLHGDCLFNADPLFKDILIQAKSRVESYGGQIYFVYLPTNERYSNNICRKRWLRLQRAEIISQVKDLHINMIDMTEYFNAHSAPLSLFDGHYNAKGYGLVAEKIEERLK